MDSLGIDPTKGLPLGRHLKQGGIKGKIVRFPRYVVHWGFLVGWHLFLGACFMGPPPVSKDTNIGVKIQSRTHGCLVAGFTQAPSLPMLKPIRPKGGGATRVAAASLRLLASQASGDVHIHFGKAVQYPFIRVPHRGTLAYLGPWAPEGRWNVSIAVSKAHRRLERSRLENLVR